MRYATFTRRFRAFVIDSACILGLWIVLFFLGDAASDVPGATHVAWLLMVAVFLLYDPLLVSRRGATVGHASAQLRVVDGRTGRWPSFARAFVRSLIKSTLGVISFFTMELTRQHQAVHDMLTHTTVQVAESAEQVEYRVERVDDPDVVLPSRLRRTAVIALYLVAVYILFIEVVARSGATDCIVRRDIATSTAPALGCSSGMEVLLQVMTWGWLALSVATIIAGWKGLLWGARRSRQVAPDVAVA